jgi:hypothetical protein
MLGCGLSASIEPPDLDIRSFAQIPQKSSSPALSALAVDCNPAR